MSSKFLIELGQGTVSVEGEEDFVKAAFCALQIILTTSEAGATSTASGKKDADVKPADASKVESKQGGVEEFGNPGEILERIRDSLSDEDEDNKAVA